MTKFALALAAVTLCTAVHAEQKPVDLAVETYQFMETGELKLQGAINGGRKADYNRFIWQPALDQLRKWPALDNDAFNKYRPCQHAVDSFRVYSEDQFRAAGQMDKNRPFYKDYFAKKKQCAALLRGKV